MTKHVGFPVELLDMAKLKEYFADLDIKPDKFFDNSAQITRFSLSKEIREFREKVNKTDWRDYGAAARVNAGYNPGKNAISLPAGILQVFPQIAR